MVVHAEICRASGNAVLHGLWLGLARQLTVIWGLGQGGRPGAAVAAEHAGLLDALARGDAKGAQAALVAHLAWHERFDFEGVIETRRTARG
jgi:DNA-binding GntR family transcriptional regulator